MLKTGHRYAARLRGCLAIVGLLVLASTAVRAQLDYPRLTSIVRESAASLKPGDTLSYRLVLQPGSAPVVNAACGLYSQGGDFYRGLRSAGGAPDLITTKIDADWLNGAYRLSFVTLTDSWGRTMTYGFDNEGKATLLGLPSLYYAGPSTHSLVFDGLGFTVSESSTRLNYSELSELSALTSGGLAPGGAARFRYVIKPGSTPWSRLLLAFRTAAGLGHAVTTDLTAPTGEIVIPIIPEMVNGRYDLASATFLYPSGGGLTYGSRVTQLVTETNGTTQALPLPYFNSTANPEFVVTGAGTTAAVPVLSSLTREGGTDLAPGSVVKFNYTTTATTPYAVRTVALRLSGPYGAVRDYTAEAASGSFTVPIEADWLSGPYTARVIVTDAAGRASTYTTNGGLTVSTGTARPSATHSFPNEAFDFAVRGTPLRTYFTEQPTARTAIAVGNEFVLTVRAVGLTATTTFAWYRGEPGDTSTPITTGVVSQGGVLSQLVVSTTVSTSYWVRATNGGVSADSTAARVVVAGPPTIAVQPVDQAGPVGGTVTYEVTAAGEGPFTYRWTGNYVSYDAGSNQRILQLKIGEFFQASTVSCEVTGPTGRVMSAPATLTVLRNSLPLSFVSESPDLTFNAGASFVTLRMKFVGNGSFRYRWQKDGVDVGDSTIVTRTSINGFDYHSADLELRNPTAQQVGGYRLIVSNGFETIYSRDVRVRLVTSPVITEQPPATYVAYLTYSMILEPRVTGQAPLTYQWRKDGVALAGATALTLRHNISSFADAGTYDLVATGPGGSITSDPTVVTVRPAPPVGQLVRGPTSVTARSGETVTFSVVTTGDADCTWSRGSVLQEGPATTFTLRSVGTSDAGTYSVAVKNGFFGATTATFTLTVLSDSTGATAPVITRAPASTTFARGETARLTVGVDGSGLLSYEWRRNGVPLTASEANIYLGPLLEVPRFDATKTGTYDVVVRNDKGAVTSAAATLSLPPPGREGRLMNVSVRANAGGAYGPLVVGFVTGGGTPEPMPLLVRAAGRALEAFGVTGTLANPVATLYSGTATRYANDDWAGFPYAAATAASVGAFPFPATGSRDSILLPSLAAGGYTVHVTSADATGGAALAEIYDATPAAELNAQRPRLINLSVQSKVDGNAEPLIVGFALGGAQPKRILVRAIGPSLAAFGVQGTLADPQVALFSGPARIHENNDWAGDAALRAAFDSVGAFALPSATSKDAALVASLTPGPYTVQVTGPAAASGLVLVEVYELP